MSRYTCLFFPDFPAWAAVHNNPDLHNRRVAISSNNSLIALSPQARAEGATTGWAVDQTLSLLSDTIVQPHDETVTATVWDKVIEELYTVTSFIDPKRPGLVMIEQQATSQIQHLQRQWATQAWPARVGVASSPTSAEMAAHVSNGSIRDIRPLLKREISVKLPMMLKHLGMIKQKFRMDRPKWRPQYCITM